MLIKEWGFFYTFQVYKVKPFYQKILITKEDLRFLSTAG